MIKAKGRYTQQSIQLDQLLQLPEGAEVELEIQPVSSDDELRDMFSELGMQRLAEEWDNPQDAIYDDWKQIYANRLP